MLGPRALSEVHGAAGRLRIALACSVCGNRNYKSTKSRRENSVLSLKKFCSYCSQHTVHIEGK